MYKGQKIQATTQKKAIKEPGPQEKNYTLVPHVQLEQNLSAMEKNARSSGRPRYLSKYVSVFMYMIMVGFIF